MPEPVKWAKEKWDVPPALPNRRVAGGFRITPGVGVSLPSYIRSVSSFERHFRYVWYMQDPRTWDMLPFVRDQWFDKILDSWKIWYRRIRFDTTRRFKVQVKKLLAKGGLVAVIGGRPAAQGDGKSIGALMFIDMLQEEFGVNVTPHILWEHSHMQFVIDDENTSGFLVLDIDEDLRATGEGSKTILIEISNTWQTNRKPKLIIISVGIDPGHSHPAVNIHLIPAGINVQFQATRFAMFAGGKYVGWTVLQRKYRPKWRVKYGIMSELSSVAEYDSRATFHSRNVLRKGVSAYPAYIEAAHMAIVLEWLELDRRESKKLRIDWEPPTIDVMVTETKQLGLPTKNISYPRRICATALRRFLKTDSEPKMRYTGKQQERLKQQRLTEAPMRAVEIVKQHFRDIGLKLIPSKEEKLLVSRSIDWSEISDLFKGKQEMELLAKQAVRVAIVQLNREEKKRKREEDRLAGREQPQHEPMTISPSWIGLRELAYALCIKKKLSLRDSTICSNYIVPDEARETRVELRRRLLEGSLKNLKIRQPSFNLVVRGKVSKKGSVITNTDLGRLGEIFTHRLLSPSLKCHVGPQSAGVCDISDRSDGDPAKAGWAVNVKVSLEDEVDRGFEISPEHQVTKSWVLLIMPRTLMMCLYPITGEQMVINSERGGLCVKPEELAERLKELIEP